MADRGKDKDTKPVFDSELPVDEEMDEESTENAELEGDEIESGAEGDEYDEDESEAGAAAIGASARASDKTGAFHFSLGRGGKTEEEFGKHQAGSVRTAHERVHVDDRLSALFALVCAGGLIGVLVVSTAAGFIPKTVILGPSLAPLVVPTGAPTPTACVTPTPVVTATPAPSASPKPTVSPKPTPALSPSASAAAASASAASASAAAAVASASDASASAQAVAQASAQASAVASFCAIPVATPTPTVAPSTAPSSAASPAASAS
jgi:hypothetical protein